MNIIESASTASKSMALSWECLSRIFRQPAALLRWLLLVTVEEEMSLPCLLKLLFWIESAQELSLPCRLLKFSFLRDIESSNPALSMAKRNSFSWLLRLPRSIPLRPQIMNSLL
ncbi:hypothetical protein FF1_009560 [Malus domestica]